MGRKLPRMDREEMEAHAIAAHPFVGIRGQHEGKIAMVIAHADQISTRGEGKIVVRYQKGYKIDRMHRNEYDFGPSLYLGKGAHTVWNGTSEDRFRRDFRPVDFEDLEQVIRATKRLEHETSNSFSWEARRRALISLGESGSIDEAVAAMTDVEFVTEIFRESEGRWIVYRSHETREEAEARVEQSSVTVNMRVRTGDDVFGEDETEECLGCDARRSLKDGYCPRCREHFAEGGRGAMSPAGR